MRGWGADYWWQNERQPYYNVLAQGDLDTMRSFLDFVSLPSLPHGFWPKALLASWAVSS